MHFSVSLNAVPAAIMLSCLAWAATVVSLANVAVANDITKLLRPISHCWLRGRSSCSLPASRLSASASFVLAPCCPGCHQPAPAATGASPACCLSLSASFVLAPCCAGCHHVVLSSTNSISGFTCLQPLSECIFYFGPMLSRLASCCLV